jgi:hypothetical protein
MNMGGLSGVERLFDRGWGATGGLSSFADADCVLRDAILRDRSSGRRA